MMKNLVLLLLFTTVVMSINPSPVHTFADQLLLFCKRKLDGNGDIVGGKMDCNNTEGVITEWENKEEIVETPDNPDFWFSLLTALLLVTLAGIMSGLTIGLLGLDMTNLEILRKSGSVQEKKYTEKIIPLLKRHHLLLVTLLLMNALAMEALPIFLEKVVPPAVAILVSVTLLLFFGEIIPQALCARYGLAIGAHLYWLVWIFIILCFPIAWPISKVLDCFFGTGHATYFKRAELKELVSIHAVNSIDIGNRDKEALSYDEVLIIKGALDLRHKTVMDKLTLIKDCFMLDVKENMNSVNMQLLIKSGHSRIPIYSGSKEYIIGMILVKTLILLDPNDALPISKLNIRPVPFVPSTMPLYNMLNIFQKGKSHLAIVVSDIDHITPLGIISLEDVIEELLQEDIVDETERDKIVFVGDEDMPVPVDLDQDQDTSSADNVKTNDQ